MSEIDKIYTKHPFYGVPRISWQLKENGNIINHKKVARLMNVMGLQAIFPKRNWLYLFAVLDWYSRFVLSWELSDNLETGFCCGALTNALKIGVPEIHNSDQGSQLTAKEYLNILKSKKDIRISMDGRGRAFDNIFTERLWRSVKYEEVYLKDYQNYFEAKKQLSNYFKFYNTERPHQSLQNKTPFMVYKTERR